MIAYLGGNASFVTIHHTGVYDIVEYTHKEFFQSLGANIRIKKVRMMEGGDTLMMYDARLND